ncbi:ABC transporter permease [Sphingomonas koreensis]|jgi:putative ABC transport system permease protein|uniref:ABC transporter permease n=1 Tax=Sphingomonas koreensis TaxID=93064 RepID=A0A1L6JB33_9SPHN|nr:ABC transporter permease [Sphingomonas koreensis]APR53113.1 ABC transporter permease [Sphingomonas koreensis]MDC7810205.1 ABC transporter permease [Sphingomonas koreensis]RSU24761.1 ABC transporter permease [Sphingomonas koreensis]RSU24933.1 ABC transporter permease [Sphingomonas koreensis]RSU26968.1 ABC transporter permease [Sphingomonas koreensis]
MFSLALAYLRDRALTTLLNVVLLGLAVATLAILLLFSTQLTDRLERDAQGIDLVVGAKGSPLQLILSSIYQLDTPTGNIPLDSVALLRRDPSIARVIPLAMGDSFRGYRIVGTEPGYLDLYGAKLAQGRVFAKSGDAVLGATAARELGAGVGQRFVGSHGFGSGEGVTGHDEHPFTTVGILAPTGTVVDRLILTPVESVWDVHGIGHEHHEGEAHEHEHDGHEKAHEHEEPALIGATGTLEPEVTALLVSYRSALAAVRVPSFVNRQTNMQAAVPAQETARLLTLFGAGIEGARIFAWLLAATGGLAIFVALLNAARAREGDLALLRVMGATRASVFGTILLEGLLTAAAGALLGLAAAHLALAVARALFDPLAEIGLDPWRVHPGELAIVGGVLIIGLVAALVPALRVFRVDLARTLARAQ